MRSTSRVCDVSFNTVAILLDMAGKACRLYHNAYVQDKPGKRNIQCDEIWSFVYAKENNLEFSEPLDAAGSVWTFTALDADSKLLVSYMVRKRRNTQSATVLMKDLAKRTTSEDDYPQSLQDCCQKIPAYPYRPRRYMFSICSV